MQVRLLNSLMSDPVWDPGRPLCRLRLQRDTLENAGHIFVPPVLRLAVHEIVTLL